MMKEISMHMLDIVQNSVRAGAGRIAIELIEDPREDKLVLSVSDDGCGMSPEFLASVRNPFTTSRTTRKVGLGIPMLEQTCLQCGGILSIESEEGKGTIIRAEMAYNHIDRPPVGDMVHSVYILMLTNQDTILTYRHQYNENVFSIDTAEIKEILGDVPMDEPEVSRWLMDTLTEGIQDLRA